jgi:hypothetical protein
MNGRGRNGEMRWVGFCFWFVVCVSFMTRTREGAERRRREGWVGTREREERSSYGGAL